jgi:hypothetical protein
LNLAVYTYAVSNPLNYLDPDGREIKWEKQSGATDKEFAAAKAMYTALKSSKTELSKQITAMEADKKHITTIRVGNKGNGAWLAKETPANLKKASTKGQGIDAVVDFDPNKKGVFPDGVKRDPTSSLGHELGHASDINTGNLPSPTSPDFRKNAEVSASNRENEFRKSMGIEQRKSYGPWKLKQF